MDNDDLAYFGTDEYEDIDGVGFDFMKLATGVAGGLAGAMGGGAKGATGAADPNAAMEKMKLEDQKEQAQRSASTMKLVLIVLGVVVGLGTLGFLVARKPSTP